MASWRPGLLQSPPVPTKVPDSRIGRLGRIMSLSGKVGGNLLARTASKLAGKDGRWAERRVAQQLVATLGQMKGLAQKMGQALSMDVDHLPRDVRDIISALQSKSEPLDYPAIAKVVEQELGKPPDRVFKTFEREPMAAASLGQVHRATLADGRALAVKVQYPGAASAMAADLKNIDILLRTVGGVMRTAGASIKGRGYFEEISAQLTFETDYRREARSAQDYAAAARPFPELRVPEVIPELSTARVLSLELLEGEPLSAILKEPSKTSNQKRLQISAGLIASLYGPLLTTGLVHADPHPGNFLVLPDGRLGVLDFGSLKRYSAEMIEAYREVYRALLQAAPLDYERLLAKAGFEVHATPQEYRPVLAQLFDLMRLPLRVDPFDFGDAQLVREFQGVARKNAPLLMKLRPPADSLMFFRAFGGQGQNLRALGATGNFAPIYARVFEVAVGDWNSSSAA